MHKFDFSDEEVMAYYISFLKTLSLKLNAHTIHFFYNEVNEVHVIVFCVYFLVVPVDFFCYNNYKYILIHYSFNTYIRKNVYWSALSIDSFILLLAHQRFPTVHGGN